MNPNIDVSIPKLSAPVEVLKIERRAARSLRRASIYTVAEVLLAGKPKLHSAKNIGAMTASRILEAVASYLGLPEDPLISEISLRVEHGYTWDAPLDVLDLSYSTLVSLQSMGLLQIHDLIKARANDYGKFLGLGTREIAETDQALRRYLARVAQAYLAPVIEANVIFDAPILERLLKKDLGSILPSCELHQRTWLILELRAMQLLSFKAISKAIGIPMVRNSTQSLFQSMRQAHERLRRRLESLSDFFDHFEARAKILQESLANDPLELKTLVSHLMPDPLGSDLIAKEREVQQIIFLMRTLVLHPSRWFSEQVEPRWPALLLLSCLVEPAITKHPQVRQVVGVPGRTQRKQARLGEGMQSLSLQT